MNLIRSVSKTTVIISVFILGVGLIFFVPIGEAGRIITGVQRIISPSTQEQIDELKDRMDQLEAQVDDLQDQIDALGDSAVMGIESLRVVRGRVAGDGTILAGVGFTVEIVSGPPVQYFIHLDSPFSDIPAATATPANFTITSLLPSSNDRVGFQFTDSNENGIEPVMFSFILIGKE